MKFILSAELQEKACEYVQATGAEIGVWNVLNTSHTTYHRAKKAHPEFRAKIDALREQVQRVSTRPLSEDRAYVGEMREKFREWMRSGCPKTSEKLHQKAVLKRNENGDIMINPRTRQSIVDYWVTEERDVAVYTDTINLKAYALVDPAPQWSEKALDFFLGNMIDFVTQKELTQAVFNGIMRVVYEFRRAKLDELAAIGKPVKEEAK